MSPLDVADNKVADPHDGTVAYVPPLERTAGQPEPIVEVTQPNGDPLNGWIQYDPVTRLDGFGATIGAFVAHQDALTGQAMVSRIKYSADSAPGQQTFDANTVSPGFGQKVFIIDQQYVSDFSGTAFDVALPDYNREVLEDSNFDAHYNLFNAGGVVYNLGGVNVVRNSKFPLASNITPTFTNGPRWDPDRIYLSIEGGLIDVFDIVNGSHIKTISTDANVTVMASYFEQ